MITSQIETTFTSPTYIEIDTDKIAKNIQTISTKQEQPTEIMAIVKANAYGTDAGIVSRFLESRGVKYFGVADLAEALHLRSEGITSEIFIFSAMEPQWPVVISHNFQLAVNSIREVEKLALIASAQRKTLRTHIHIDTGMHRFGCHPNQVTAIAKQIVARPTLTLEGIMTHFSSADKISMDSFTLRQASIFDECIQKVKDEKIHIPLIHCSNTAATLRFHFPQTNMVRIGIGLFGIPTSKDVPNVLSPALSLKSEVIAMSECAIGETVSYSQTFRAERKTQIAVIPVGYMHGLHRCYSNRAEVMVRGQRAPIIGNITMNYTLIDVTDVTGVLIGDCVTLFGDEIDINDFANSGDTIAHELITCLHPSIPRRALAQPAIEQG